MNKRRLAGTLIFDAFVNLVLQGILWFFAVFTFVWVSPVCTVIWFVYAIGIGALLSKMQHWAVLRRGAGFKNYLLCSVVPVNVIGTILAIVNAIVENYNYSHYNSYNYHGIGYRYFPCMIFVGTVCVTGTFFVLNRFTAAKRK